MTKQEFTGNYYDTFDELQNVRKKEWLGFKGKCLDNDEDTQEIKSNELKSKSNIF
jgi:hypothetical protein